MAVVKTVLEYVQDALSVLDSDEVDTINDTVESRQIAAILESAYYELMFRQDWEFLKGPIMFTSTGDITDPTRFEIPTSVRYVENISYNTNTDPTILTRVPLVYLPVEEFLTRNQAAGTTRRLVTYEDRLQFYVSTDRNPSVWTSFDDRTIHMDAFKTDQGSTLLTTRMSGYGVNNPSIVLSDEAIPFMPDNFVPLLTATVNATAMNQLKQSTSEIDERRATRQLARLRRNQSAVKRESYYANRFGR